MNEKLTCKNCGHSYDLQSWRKLAVRSMGTVGTTEAGVEMATALVQERQCSCGAGLVFTAPFERPISPAAAALELALAALDSSTE